MSLKDKYSFDNLENEGERLVLEELEKQLEDDSNAEVCKCKDCVVDMAAFALNNIRPMYRSSLTGKLFAYALDRTDYANEVREAVRKSIEKYLPTLS